YATQTGVYVHDTDHDCPDTPELVDVFVMDRTDPAAPAWRYHARGYTNAPTDPVGPFDFMTFIPFKFPLSTNLPGSDVLVRTYKREDGNCSSDAVDWFNYTNYFPASVAVESTYRSFGRSITFEQVGAYRAVADRNGGAFYEFYNLRMGDPTLPHNDENAI